MKARTSKTEPEISPVARERLTRDRVVDAALRIMDEEGLDAVTMRRVAREVGVEAMSLYHYVQDKEDLLDGICTQVMKDFRFPNEDRPWNEVARDGAREWRRVLRQHPNVMAVWADRQRPMTDLEGLMPMEFALRVIGRAGMDAREGVQVFNVLGGYIMGVVMMEVGAMFSGGSPPATQPSHLHKKMGDEAFSDPWRRSACRASRPPSHSSPSATPTSNSSSGST